MSQPFGDWRDTSWQHARRSHEKITILEVIEHLSTQEVIEIKVTELQKYASPGGTPDWAYDPKRVAIANLEYPIIIVQWTDPQGYLRYILDGNHRFQKAINDGVESIKTKTLDLDNAETPESYKKLFMGESKWYVWREYSGGAA